ncbi:MAG: hypothetical protein IT374_20495 [Polyangiaceae bacterium]|nr:hypothetical protein [Polyangiaceae bacterium]
MPKASRWFLPLVVSVVALAACAEETPQETLEFTPASVSGDIPCEFDKSLAVCRNCHGSPLKSGAPFPLLRLGDIRGSYNGKTVAERAASALTTRFMPQPPYDKELTDDQRARLTSWFQMGAPLGMRCN